MPKLWTCISFRDNRTMLKPRPTPYFEVYWFSPVPLVGFKALSLLHKPKQILIHTIPDVFFFFF